MSEFSTEPMFRDTYTIVLRYFRNNLIDVLDDMPWLGKLSWLQLLVYILAVGSHTGGVLERIANGADMVQLSGDLSATLVLWQVTVLYVEIYGKRKLIKKLILNLEALWSSDDKLRLEMEEIKRQSVKSIYKWISQFYKILTCYMHFYFCLPFFATAVRHFVLKEDFAFTTIYKLKVPFQYEDNFLLYWVASMIDYGVLYNTGLLITSDLLLVNVSMNHLRTLFVILQDDLKNIVHSNEPFEETATSRLKRIIPKHANLLQLMAELSEAFGAIFLIHLAFFSGTMCFFGFAARVHCSPESIKNLLASSFILICIYSCCSYGQDLTDASLDVANAAYEGPWHLMSHEYRLCILFIMLRSQKAYYIRSTSFTNISLQSFTKILNVTWSFLSLIDKVYED
ncbi:odorant receptor 85c-like isoform X1 [Choristoneura fumiferana]|uniref:odorant receptor 85c-like isoform X1 n=1 Tax=Choristoneura fumiferana TaxID=7141 RepID=UPI003D15C662